MGWTPWPAAWRAALYGPDGFYRQPAGPAGHFATSTQGAPGLGRTLAEALVRLMQQEGLTTFVDMGCGRGELVGHVHAVDPSLTCIGVDVVARPDLDPAIGWVRGAGGADVPAELGPLERALVLANEWLDVVPCTIAEVDHTGVLRAVLVDPPTGDERLGDPLEEGELQWCRQFWPLAGRQAGERVEVGLARDQAWDGLLRRVGSGLAVAVDYGHVAATRPRSGTLAGYRHGALVRPVPDGTCDLTAHVAMDSLRHDELLDQRTALRGLGVDGSAPPRELALADPAAYLQALSGASAAAALTAPGGLGDFRWAIRRIASPPPPGRH